MVHKKRFTFIELLVVVSILIIIFSFGYPTYESIITNANLRACQSNQKLILEGLSKYSRNHSKNFPSYKVPDAGKATGRYGRLDGANQGLGFLIDDSLDESKLYCRANTDEKVYFNSESKSFRLTVPDPNTVWIDYTYRYNPFFRDRGESEVFNKTYTPNRDDYKGTAVISDITLDRFNVIGSYHAVTKINVGFVDGSTSVVEDDDLSLFSIRSKNNQLDELEEIFMLSR